MTGRKPSYLTPIVAAAGLAFLLSGFALRPLAAAGQSSSAAGAGASAGRGQDTHPPGPPPGRGGNNNGPGWEWWNDADVQKELGLTTDKVQQIDDFYQRRVKEVKAYYDEWMKQSQALDVMTKAAVVDESTYGVQLLRVEGLRSRLVESRTMMLYRIYRILQPDQYRKLQDILDRRARAMNGRGRE